LPQTRIGQGGRKVLFVSLGHNGLLPNSLPWFLSCPAPFPSCILSYKKQGRPKEGSVNMEENTKALFVHLGWVFLDIYL